MRLRVGCELAFEAPGPVPMLMLVRVRPDGPHWPLREATTLEPEQPMREYLDGFGNRCWRFTAPPGQLVVRYDAVVALAREPDPVVPDAPLLPAQDLPDETLVFTLPSRQVESDLLLADAERDRAASLDQDAMLAAYARLGLRPVELGRAGLADAVAAHSSWGKRLLRNPRPGRTAWRVRLAREAAVGEGPG